MPKLLIFSVLLSILLLSCQKEFDPFVNEQSRTDSTQMSDTIKALVIDGPIWYNDPADSYDSIVYHVTGLNAIITHYQKNGTLDHQEFIAYDSQERVTSYRRDWNGTYRYTTYGYTGSGKVPTTLIDSTDDSDFFFVKYTATSSTPSGGGIMHTFQTVAYVNSNPPDTSTAMVYFNNNDYYLRSQSDINGQLFRHTAYYNTSGLVDSVIGRLTYPSSAVEKDSFWIRYTPHNNPLHQLSKMIYKNLYKYTYAGMWSGYADLLMLPFALSGVWETKFPSSNGHYSDPFSQYSYDYTPQLENGVIRKVSIKFTNLSTGQSRNSILRIH